MAEGKPMGSQLQQYYVAVSTCEAKLATLVELVHALEPEQQFSMAVCCGTRDVLDSVITTLRSVQAVSLWVLHADLTELEVKRIITKFKEQLAATNATDGSAQISAGQDEGSRLRGTEIPLVSGAGEEDQNKIEAPVTEPTKRIQALVTTDASLKLVAKDDIPLALPLLLHYDPPMKKDVLLRRQSTVLGGRTASTRKRIAVSFVVANELSSLQMIQSFSGGSVLEEMPVQVSDIFG